MGQLCEDLNIIAGYGIYYDTFEIQNTKWLWLVNNIVTTMNGNKVLCGSFGVYPSYVAGILNSVKRIHFFVLHSEKLNYADYVKKCIVSKERTFKLPTDYSFKVVTAHRFQLTFGGETVTISIEARQFQKLPSELTFAQCVLKTMRLSSLTYGIVCINNRVTYINNEVLKSKHDCVFDLFAD
jgi:hypothetical protein